MWDFKFDNWLCCHASKGRTIIEDGTGRMFYRIDPAFIAHLPQTGMQDLVHQTVLLLIQPRLLVRKHYFHYLYRLFRIRHNLFFHHYNITFNQILIILLYITLAF